MTKNEMDKSEMKELRAMLRQRHRDMKEWGCTRIHLVNGRRLKNNALIDYLHERIEFLSARIAAHENQPPARKRRQVGPSRGRRGGV